MGFFDVPPPRRMEFEGEETVPPAWSGPRKDVLGALVPIERVLFRGETLVLVLTSATVFPEGVDFEVTMGARRSEGVDDETWWSQRELLMGSHFHLGPDRPLPEEIERFGVRFSDGSKATIFDGMRQTPEWPPSQPDSPVLLSLHGKSEPGGRGFVCRSWHLWLWPLPPPEPFEFVVEWPAFDVPLTFTEIDAAPLVSAATRAQPFWP
ncbi:hypothetical protein [Microtetraspora niveoalba]|uniref:hypothetical protein n=1 Tax=Microtetraspora niveoalba TaxID=46175 RepID=UPI00082C6521|nr:hypothetical protein [Microtetraspora niveoalba]